MKKICLVSYGEVTDPKTWSRTPLRIYENFSNDKNIELSELNLKPVTKSLIGFSRILGRIIYRRNTLRDPLLYKQTSAWVARYSMQNIDTSYLFIAEHTINYKKNPNCKYYVYLDSLLRPYHIYDERKMKPLAREFLKAYEKNDRACFLEYDGIFTQNQWSKDFLINEYGIDADKIHNVGFGINAKEYSGEKDYTNKQLMIVLRRGTEYIKGLYLLLDAFKIAKKEDKDLSLKVFGTTCEEISGVEYYENKPREFMLDAYRTSSLFVLPNILEPNGISYLEALANKTPIIGLDRFSAPEFTGNGLYGFICEKCTPEALAKTILDAISNPKRLEIMGIQGQQFVRERYDWDIVINKIKRVIVENE